MVSRNSPRLTWQQRATARTYWKGVGLHTRQANGLVDAGYCSLDDLKDLSDHDLSVIANVGPKGKAILYGLLGRARLGAQRVLTREI